MKNIFFKSSWINCLAPLALLIPVVVNAASPIICDVRPVDERKIREAAFFVIDSAIAAPISNNSAAYANLARFRAEAGSVRICILPASIGISGSGHQRFTAVYSAKEKVIYVNPLQLRETSWGAMSATLLVHEYFGALGYLDENYELTVALRGLAARDGLDSLFVGQLGTFPRRENLEIDYGRDNRNYLAKGGGSSGVGGGGDATSLYLKVLFTNLDYLKLVKAEAKNIGIDCSTVDLEVIRNRALRIGFESEEVESDESLRVIMTDDEFGYKIVLNRKFFPHTDILQRTSDTSGQRVALIRLLLTLTL